MIKAIIFDCFGVVRTDSFDEAYRSMGGDPDKDREFILEVQSASNSGRISSSVPIVAKRLGIDPDEWMQANLSAGSVDLELLKYIQGLKKVYKIGMLSNVGSGGLVPRFFEPGFLEQYFDDVVTSSNIGFAKPEAQAYEISAARLDVRLDECIFVDDRQEYVDGATATGMKSVLYRSFQDLKMQLQNILTKLD